jgi:hypothetical protein
MGRSFLYFFAASDVPKGSHLSTGRHPQIRPKLRGQNKTQLTAFLSELFHARWKKAHLICYLHFKFFIHRVSLPQNLWLTLSAEARKTLVVNNWAA